MAQLNRRNFLRTSAAAASTVFAAPAIGRAGISANDKIGVVVIGVNSRGSSHIDAFLSDARTEIRAIVDVDDAVGNKRCAAIEDKQGLRPTLYTDMR